MATNSSDRARLLDDEPTEEVVNETYSHQAYTLPAMPPPYQMVAGLPPYSSQSISGQNSVENHHTPASNQSPPPMYYTYLPPGPGQRPFSNGIATLPPGQPVYLMPATGQPFVISHHGVSQTRPNRTQPRSTRAPRTASEPDSDNDVWVNCCFGVLVIIIGAVILFALAVLNMKPVYNRS